MIFKSSTKLILSTYQTSSLNFSSQLIALLPFTCAQPVMPGFTACLRFCSLLYRGRYCRSRGRGLIKLMSPLITFHHCGNSSKEVFRMTRPPIVKHRLSERRLPKASLLLFIVRSFTKQTTAHSYRGLLEYKKEIACLANK